MDLEAASPGSAAERAPAVRVCEKLRVSLTRFAGADGFASLLRRALALARAEVPSLQRITINPDCSMEGFQEFSADANGDPGVVIVTHLLGLLVTFIGEGLTLRLVRETWPDASLDE
jgi:hypothetical protein